MRNTNMNATTHCITKPSEPASSRLSTACLVGITLLVSACGGTNWYQGAKASGEAQCLKLPPVQYNECMRSYDKTYNEYNKQREEAIGK